MNFNPSQLQHNLDLVVSLTDHWQLKLSPTKCSVMRLNPRRTVTVASYLHSWGYSLPVNTQCSDLGVSYDEHFSYTSHVSRIVNKAPRRAKCILKCFTSRDSLFLTRAFCTSRIFINHLEPILQEWNK